MPRYHSPTTSAIIDALGFGGEPLTEPRVFAANSPAFPPATVLPGDDLHIDPGYPPQTFDEFMHDPDRSHCTKRRSAVYVVRLCGCGSICGCDDDSVGMNDLISYLAAYFHGLPVLKLPRLRLEAWNETRKSAGSRKRARKDGPQPSLAARTPTTLVRLRVRSPSPDGFFPRQLHLSDVLDACLDTLPSDAFSILCVTPEDLYEQEEDDDDENLFTCGRLRRVAHCMH
jgi:archaemetzincin